MKKTTIGLGMALLFCGASYVSAGTSFESFNLTVPAFNTKTTSSQIKEIRGADSEVNIRYMPNDKTMKVRVESEEGAIGDDYCKFENLGTLYLGNRISEGSHTFARFKSGASVWVDTVVKGSFRSN